MASNCVTTPTLFALTCLMVASIVAATDDEIIASIISTPVPLWPTSLAPSGGTPSLGVRAAIYSASSVPAELMVPLLWQADAAGTQRILMQYRITSDEATPSTALFDVNGNGGCEALLIPTNSAVISTPSLNVTDDNITTFAGGLLTCDWSVYDAGLLNADRQLRFTPFDLDIPTFFDAASTFDVLLWPENASALLAVPVPTYNYLLATQVVSNSTTVHSAIVNNGSSGYVSSSVDVSTFERTWYFDESDATFATAAVTTLGADTSVPLVLNAAAGASTQHLRRAFCYVADLASYIVQVVPSGDTLDGSIMGITRPVFPDAVPSPTLSAAEMMEQCDDDQWCLGFTTSVNDAGDEVGLAYLRTRPIDLAGTLDTATTFVRLAHWKRASGLLAGEVACSATVATATDVVVHVASANVEVVILVNGTTAATCTPDPFACGAMTICGALRIDSSAQIDVLVTSIDTANPYCAHSELSVIFDTTTSSASYQTVTPTVAASTPIKEFFSTTVQDAQLYRKVVLPSSTSNVFYMYVHNIVLLEAFVQQNSFGGSLTNLSVPAVSFNAVGDQTNGTQCGGAAGFVNVSGPGYSDRCDVNAQCPSPVLTNTSGFTGFIKITVDWSTITKGFTGLWKCGNASTLVPELILHFTAMPLSSATVYGWLGAVGGDRTVYPLYLTLGYGGQPTGSVSLGSQLTYKLFTSSFMSQDYEMFAMRNTTIFTTSAYSENTVRLACVVDTFGLNDRSCVFPIPHSALYVTLSFEDSNLVSNAIPYRILDTTTGDELWSGVCGGGSGFIDGIGTSATCGSYRTCLVSLTDWMDASTSDPYATRLVLDVPKAIGATTSCKPFAFAAVAEFINYYPDGVGGTCDGFTCKRSGECVDLNDLCDGSLNCADGSDESNCYNWFDVELDATLTYAVLVNSSDPTTIPTDFTVETDDDCLALAMRNGSTVYAYSTTLNSCLVYNFSSTLLNGSPFDFSASRVSTTGFTVSTVLTSALQYSTCSDHLTCSGNGVAGKMASGACACACTDPFTGNTCEDFQDIKTDYSDLYIMFPAATGTDAAKLTSDQVAQGLKRWYSTGVFACDAPLRVNDTVLSVLCKETTGSLTESIVTNASTLSAFNAKFALVGPPGLMASNIAPTSVPKFSTSGSSCSLQDGSLYACELVAPIQISRLAAAVTLQDVSGAGTINVNMTFQATTRRRSGGATHSVLIPCPASSGAASTGKDMKTKLTCLVDVASMNPNGDLVTAYTVTVLDSNGVAVPLTSGGSGASQASFIRLLLVPALFTPSNPATVEEDFTVFQWAAIALIAFGVALLGLIISLCCIHRKHVKRVTNAAIRGDSSTSLVKVVSSLFAKMTKIDAFESDADETGEEIRDSDGLIVQPQRNTITIQNVHRTLCCASMNKRKYAFLCSSFWLCAWIVGVFFVLYFITSASIVSDTWVVVERYGDGSCQNSTMSPTPQATFYITDNTATECQRRQIAGQVSVNFYFSGWCYKNASGDNVLAKYRTGLTKKDCEATEYTEIQSDSCIPSGSTWGKTTGDATFTRIACGTIETAVDRFGYLLTLSTATDPYVASTVVQTPSSKLSGSLATGQYALVGVRQSSTFRSSAPVLGLYENFAFGVTPAPLLGQQGYIQEVSELFQVKSAPFYSPVTAALEDSFQSSLSQIVTGFVPAPLRPYLPPYTPESLPIGQLYGQFNTTNALQDGNAGPSATRYYGLERTLADVGAYIDVNTMQEGQGFTIAFMLRASSETHGFAFGLTDSFEDNAKVGSPILDLMLNILKRNADGTYWFTEDYHIYHSLLVDGPGQQLQFIYASPATVMGGAQNTTANAKRQGKTLSILTWNMESLKLLRIFNGLWHQVRIVLRMETGTIKAQLIVDGETSRSTFGWNQCVSNPIPKATTFPVNTPVQVYSKSQSVGSGTMLWAGYLNGGVGNLRYLPLVEDIFDIWKGSSAAVQQFNDINEVRYLALGWVMFGCAAGAFGYLFVTSLRALYQSSKRAKKASITAMYERFRGIMANATPAADGTPYQLLKLATALRWLDVNEVQLGQLLDELQQSTNRVSEELIRLLYLSGQALLDNRKFKDIRCDMPTPAMWSELIQADEDKYIADHTWDIICYKKVGQPEEELVKVALPLLDASVNSGGADQTPMRPSSSAQRAATPGGEYATDQGAQAQALQNVAGQRGQAHVQQGGVGEVNTGNLSVGGGGGGGGALSMSSGATASFDMDLKQLFFPILTVVQSVYLWISSSNFVGQYLSYFGEAFSFISIDFVTTFQLPTLVTPLVQLLAGLLAFFILLYLTAMDEMRFSWYVARYVLRRDSEEHVNTDHNGSVTGRTDYCNTIIGIYNNPYGLIHEFPVKYDVEVLPMKDAMRVDRFVGISSVDDEEDERALEGANTLTVQDRHGRPFTLERTEAASKLKGHEQAAALTITTGKGAEPSQHMEVVGVCCRQHKKRRLSPQIQTDVWPFLYPPKCCVVVNGIRCDVSQGTIFSCQCPVEQEDGATCLCDYAVCERHYRGGLVDGIIAEVLAVVRQADQRGLQWVVATIAMLGANAAYMPFVKTAIMILGCHPVYQCEFTQCHDFSNQKYLVAFYLALCVVVLFGLGLPLLQVLQLRRRRNMLFHTFFADEYRGRYEEKDSDEHDARTIAESLQRNQLGHSATFDSTLRASSRRGASRGGSRRGRPASALPDVDRDALDLEGTTPNARAPERLFNASSSKLARLESSASRPRRPVITMQEGIAALGFVTPAVLAEIHSLTADAPPALERTLKAVAIALSEPVDAWPSVLAMTQHDAFIMRLEALSPSTINDTDLMRLSAFVADPANSITEIGQTSTHATYFVTWLRGIVDEANKRHFPQQNETSEPSTPLGGGTASPRPQEDAPAMQLASPPNQALHDEDEMFGQRNGRNAIPIHVVDNLFGNTAYPPVGLRPVTPELPAESSDDDMEVLDDHAISANGGKVLKTKEWDRFLASDPTVLGTLYKSLAFNWIYLSPILLLWKVVLICPAVFLPFETFEQLVGICATEVGFALFIFVTAPFTSPIVDVMYRVGSIHQLLFLGFRSFDIRARYLGNADFAFPMVLLTFAYLGFSVLCILWTMIGPQIRKVWDKKRSTSTLEGLGYQYTLTTSLYVVPSTDGVRTRVVELDEDSPLLGTVISDLTSARPPRPT